MAALTTNLLILKLFLAVNLLIVISGFSTSNSKQLKQLTVPKSNPVCFRRTKGSSLYMGRHAVVRALTKARTDGAKSKNNSR